MVSSNSTTGECEMQEEIMGFKCGPDLKEVVHKAAKSDDRTVSSWMRHILRRAAEAELKRAAA